MPLAIVLGAAVVIAVHTVVASGLAGVLDAIDLTIALYAVHSRVTVRLAASMAGAVTAAVATSITSIATLW